MSVTTSRRRVAVSASVLERAESVLETLGIPPSVAADLFFTQVALKKAIPFDVAIPAEFNPASTVKAHTQAPMAVAASIGARQRVLARANKRVVGADLNQ